MLTVNLVNSLIRRSLVDYLQHCWIVGGVNLRSRIRVPYSPRSSTVYIILARMARQNTLRQPERQHKIKFTTSSSLRHRQDRQLD